LADDKLSVLGLNSFLASYVVVTFQRPLTCLGAKNIIFLEGRNIESIVAY
jgi:hypothetical protein